MAESITIARPYARAAFEAASAAGSLPAWSGFLARAAAAVTDVQIEPLIGNPRVPTGELVELLLELDAASAPRAAAPVAVPRPPAAASAVATATATATVAATATATAPATRESAEQRNFLALVAHNQRLTLLPQIAARYERLRADAERLADVQVSSARELTAAQAAELAAALERRLGRTVRLHVSVDATLLGGAVVHYGDYVVDGSLRGQLERLAAAVAGA